MSTMIPVEQAQVNLKELIHQLAPGEEIIFTENNQPVAKLIREQLPQLKPRVAGTCKGMIKLLVEDDEHLKDFKEYME